MRDIQRSGQCAGEVIQQVSDTVYPMYKAFIERDLEKAEIKVVNNFNPFAGFKEPVQILKTSDPVSVDAAADVLRKLFPNAEISQVCIQLPSRSILCRHSKLNAHVISFFGLHVHVTVLSMRHSSSSQVFCMKFLWAVRRVVATFVAFVVRH